MGDCSLRYDENSYHFNSIYSPPGSVVSNFHLSTCFILKTALGGSYYYDPHVTDGETEARGGKSSLLKVTEL